MTNKIYILSPSYIFHIFNRANGSEKIFIEQENYRFFLQQYQLHLSAYIDTYCYCLIPNHFHLVKVKEEKGILELQRVRVRGEQTFPKFEILERLRAGEISISPIISKAFSNFFSSNTQAFNKQYKRKGSLFMKNFKRKEVSDERYLLKLIHYIHHNPLQARLCAKPEDWPYSSFRFIVKNEKSFINKNHLLELFAGIKDFEDFHKLSPSLNEIR